ncbi:MAG: glutamate ABC transporter substrate-binding protein [Mycobacteriales bacterium]
MSAPHPPALSARAARAVRRRVAAKMLTVAVAVGVAAGAAACSAGSGPKLPSPPTAAAGTTPAPAVPATCTNDAQTVASYRPSGPLPAPDALPAGSYMAKIKQRGRLNVAVSADTLLFSFRNPVTGTLEGFDVEMAKLVAAAIFGTSDGHISYKVVNYAQRIPSLQDGSVDLVADVMTINCARWKQINFSTEYYHAGQKLLVATDSKATGIKSFEKSDQQVCVATGSTNLDELKANYPQVKRREVGDVSDCMVLFQQGEVAAVTGDDTVLAGFLAQDPYAKIVGSAFTSEPYGLGIAKPNVDFTKFVNAVVQKARTDGTWRRFYTEQIKPKPGEKIPSPPPALYGRNE